MDYYSFKFDAFLIEYKFLSTQFGTNSNQLLFNEKLKSLNAKLVSALIEFYVSLSVSSLFPTCFFPLQVSLWFKSHLSFPIQLQTSSSSSICALRSLNP
jgi:hypothetical protein